MMIKTMDHIERRLKAYWFIDGLAEIGCGLLFLVLSLPYLAWSLVPEGSSSAKMASTSRDVILLVGLVCLFVVVGAAKQRSTYPRSGYIQEQHTFERKLIKAGFILIGILLLAIVIFIAGILFVPAIRDIAVSTIAFFPVCFGCFYAAVTIIGAVQTGLHRFYWLALCSILVSVVLAFATFAQLQSHSFDMLFLLSKNPTAPMPLEGSAELNRLFHSIYRQLALQTALIGLGLFISGIFTRRKYLSENPLYKMAADDR
jgi:hypothetical protein